MMKLDAKGRFLLEKLRVWYRKKAICDKKLETDAMLASEYVQQTHLELIDEQKLYERWLSKPKWRLQQEGLPLLLKIDPNAVEDLPAEQKESMMEHWRHACHCVEHGLLVVNNRKAAPEEWLVSPQALYQWASVSRLPLSQALVNLMEFVTKTVKPEIIPERQKTDHLSHQVIFLGAALSLLVNKPGHCRDESGIVKVDRMMDYINRDRKRWFSGIDLSLSKTAQRDLLEKYVRLKD